MSKDKSANYPQEELDLPEEMEEITVSNIVKNLEKMLSGESDDDLL